MKRDRELLALKRMMPKMEGWGSRPLAASSRVRAHYLLQLLLLLERVRQARVPEGCRAIIERLLELTHAATASLRSSAQYPQR